MNDQPNARVVRPALAAALRGPDQIHVQPIVDTAGVVVALEALARYTGRTPDEVFAAAERGGVRVAVELAAARAALGALPHVPAGVRLSVNISASALTEPTAISLFTPHAGRLWIEVTEVEAVMLASRVPQVVEQLRACGAVIVVDDAGAKHSTVRQVLILGADVVKLDRDLVRDAINGDTARRRELDQLVDAARSLGARVVAEGVEDAGDIAAAVSFGVDLLQGYATGRPRPCTSAPAV